MWDWYKDGKNEREEKKRETCMLNSPHQVLIVNTKQKKERKTKTDRWRAVKENMLSRQRSFVDCSSAVPDPIDHPQGARISQLYLALSPTYTVHKHNTQTTALSITRDAKRDAYMFLMPFYSSSFSQAQIITTDIKYKNPKTIEKKKRYITIRS